MPADEDEFICLINARLHSKEIDFLQKFAKFDSNLGGLRERIWQPALLLVSANRSCGRIHAA